MKNWSISLLVTAALLAGAGVASAQNENGSRSPNPNAENRLGKPEWTPSVINGSAVLAEGFDDITTLTAAGWVQTNQSAPLGTSGWFQGNDTVFTSQAGAAPSYIGANFNNTAGAGTIDNWLITPVLPLNSLTSFSFWTRSPDDSPFPDTIEVRMNPTNTGSATADFTSLLTTIDPVSVAGWVQTTITNFPGAPAQGRLAFRYFVTDAGPLGNNSNYIGIDSVVADAGVVSPTLSLGTVTAADMCASAPASNNGILEPGEVVTLTLPLTAANGGFTNVTGMLSSSTAGVTVLTGMGNYGAVADGATVSANYSVRLESTLACNSSVALTLAVTSSEGNSSFPITRTVGVAGAPVYAGLPASIPDNAPATGGTSTALVSNVPGVLTNVTANVQITHTWVGDLTITLTSPAGTVVTLLDRPGVPGTAVGCANNDVNVTFADGGADLESVCGAGPAWAPTAGAPATPLSALNGENANGTWTLRVTDSAGGDTGSVTGWTLNLSPAPSGTCNVCASNPTFGFNTGSISFGNVATGGTSAAQFVTLSNTGAGPGTVTALTFAGPFSASGGTCGAVPIQLAAGASCTIGVVFNAGAIGSFNGSLTATAGAQTLVVALAGGSILPPPAFIPTNNFWALGLMIALMGLMAGVFVSRRQG